MTFKKKSISLQSSVQTETTHIGKNWGLAGSYCCSYHYQKIYLVLPPLSTCCRRLGGETWGLLFWKVCRCPAWVLVGAMSPKFWFIIQYIQGGTGTVPVFYGQGWCQNSIYKLALKLCNPEISSLKYFIGYILKYSRPHHPTNLNHKSRTKLIFWEVIQLWDKS